MKQNYGAQILTSYASKGLKDIKIYFLISIIGSITSTLFAIEYIFPVGAKSYFYIVWNHFWYNLKLNYLAEKVPFIFTTTQNDFEIYTRINEIWNEYLNDTYLFIGIFLSLFTLFMFLSFFLTRMFGKNFQSQKFERADELRFVEPKELKKEIKEEVKRKNNDIVFTKEDLHLGKNKIRVPFATASTHIGFCGASRTGKTNGMNELLIQDREIGSKCLIVDPRGQFFAKHGRPGDKILSLFDLRQQKWDFWCEKIAFKFLADALVEVKESSNNNKFFDKSGREVLAAALRHTKSLDELWQVVNYDEESLHDFLVDKKELSKQLLGKKASGQSAGIIATSILNMGFIKSMNHHVYEREKASENEEKCFSLTEWVNNDEDNSWIFIIDDIRNLPEAQPLHRLWFDIVTSTAYDRDINKQNLRQINLYCDEITTVGNLPTLPSVLDKGRNFRLRLIIGFQSYAQLEIIYGKDSAANIFQGLQSVVIFASNNEAEARIFSERMGRSTVIEVDQSLGIHDKHNNANLSYKTRQIDNVTASQIQALKDNFCFLKLARFNPTKIEFRFHKMKTINIASNSIVPERTKLDDVDIKPYESEAKKKEQEVKQAQEGQNNKFQERNNQLKSMVEEASELLSSEENDQEKINALGRKILERYGKTQGFKAKFGENFYAISIYKPKKMIYISSNDYEFSLPFPNILFNPEDETAQQENKGTVKLQAQNTEIKVSTQNEESEEESNIDSDEGGIQFKMPLEKEDLKFQNENHSEIIPVKSKFKSVSINLKKQPKEEVQENKIGI